MLRRLFTGCVRGVSRESLGAAIRGGLIAICVATVFQQLAALLGTSPPAALSLVITVVAGLACGVRTPHEPQSSKDLRAVLLHLGMTAWIAATPWLLQAADSLIAHPAVIEASAAGRNVWTLAAICLVLGGIPAAICGRLATHFSVRAGGKNRLDWLLFGAAAGIALWGFGLAQVLGPWYCGLAAAGFGSMLTIVRWVRTSQAAAPSLSPGDHSDADSAGVAPGLVSLVWRWLLDGAIAAGSGGLLAAFVRILEQVFPGTIYLVVAEAVGIAAGLGIGLWWAERRRPSDRGRFAACVGLAAWGAAFLAAFPILVEAALWLNAYVASPWVMLTFRGILVGLVVAPIGVVMGICLKVRRPIEAGQGAGRIRWWMICGAAGYCTIVTSGGREFGPAEAIVWMAWGLTVAALLRFRGWEAFASTGEGSTRDTAVAGSGSDPTEGVGSSGRGLLNSLPIWLGRGALAASLAAVACSSLWRDNFDVRLSSRLLFNTNVFIGHRAGFAPESLPYLDDGRHVATIHGPRGITTVWRYCGRQLQVRDNGMPAGVVSCDPDVFPRFLPETMQTALPLMLHSKPQNLLLLGLGSGESLLTGLAFPLPEIVCWEPDAGRVRFVREVVAENFGFNPLNDERVRLTAADPALALDAEPGQYDAIVSSPDHAALLRTQPYFTRPFYLRVARRLSPRGVFCQRLQYIDLGPRPVQTVVRTMQSVFSDVIALEAAPGELLLAATNDSNGLLRARLVRQLQLPHVRGLLAQSGVDWSAVLNLAVCRNDGLAEFAARGLREPNQPGNDRLMFSSPREVMRWGDKLEEMRTTLASSSGRLLDCVKDEKSAAMLLRRMSEVADQQDLMANHSERYWSYRSTLRTQLTRKPRNEVRQVAATDEDERKTIHPDDQKRLRYFLALDRATRTLEADDIRHLGRFEFPYDPLVSYFLHHEMAELFARSAQRDAREELQHRLHAIWFASPRDASLRHVVAALKLVRELSGAEPDPLRRWDTLNALLQALQRRWDARTGVAPTSVQAAIDDIDATLQAAEKTFEAMNELTRDAGLPPEIWAARRGVLERTLISPVKSYRSTLLPRLHRKHAQIDDGETGPAPEPAASHAAEAADSQAAGPTEAGATTTE